MALARMRMDELVNAWVGDRHTPFQLGLLGVFDAGPWQRPDGTIDVARLRLELARRARGVADLRRRVLWTRHGEGRPLWVEDPTYDPARHIVSTSLPPGDDLASWAANRCVRPLDLDRPLWRADIVDGIPEGSFAVLIVVHHILADGLAGVRIVGSLLDSSQDAKPGQGSPPAVAPLPSHRELVMDRLASVRASRRRAAPGGSRSPEGARHPKAGFRDAMEGFRIPLPATSLPRRVGPERRMVIATERLPVVLRAGHVLGVTVNDLVLAVVTDGLRDLLSGRGEALDGLFLRTTVPMVTGDAGQVMGMMVIDLPVAEPDPLRRLARINHATTTRKAQVRAGGNVTDILRLPFPLLRVFVRWGRRIGSSRINLSVSNVPGPAAPLWLAGARMLEAVPVAPLVPLVPISVAALSYGGSLAVAVNADASLVDLDLVRAGMTRSFSRYRELAALGEHPPQP